MKDTRETIRFNTNNLRDAKLYDYLEKVKGKRKGAFIKEAMEYYIEMIELGLYECPFLEDEKEEESKFRGILKQITVKEHIFEEDIKKEADEAMKKEAENNLNCNMKIPKELSSNPFDAVDLGNAPEKKAFKRDCRDRETLSLNFDDNEEF